MSSSPSGQQVSVRVQRCVQGEVAFLMLLLHYSAKILHFASSALLSEMCELLCKAYNFWNNIWDVFNLGIGVFTD